MKTRFRYFFQTLFTFVLLFIVQKPLFMLFHITLFKQYSFKDWLQVPYHALWQDISIAACLTLIPSILLLITIWSRAKLWRRLAKIYFFIASLVITIVFILDSALYSSVGSHIRATQWSILQHTPKALLGHLSAWTFVGSVLGIFIIFALVFRLFYFMLNSNQLEKKLLPLNKPFFTILYLILIGIIFIPTKGLFTQHQQELCKAFSTHTIVNDAALNPLLSMFDNTHTQVVRTETEEDTLTTKAHYHFMSTAEVAKKMKTMLDPDVLLKKYNAPKFWLLNTPRPNIIFIMVDGLSIHDMQSAKNITPQLNKLSKEALYFQQFYANSSSAANGITATLCALPNLFTSTQQENLSQILQKQPSLIKEMSALGYTTHYIYGGNEENDEITTALKAIGIQSITTSKQFNNNQLTKHGEVYNHILLHSLLTNLKQEKNKKPWLKIVQLASNTDAENNSLHRFSKKQLNTFAYTDNCIGQFITQCKKLPLWKNTLFIIMSTHSSCTTQATNKFDTERYHIPLLMFGGALKGPGNIDIYASQTDVAATLCGQLGHSHQMFRYSKDIFNPASPHFAFFMSNKLFGFFDQANQVTYHLQKKTIILSHGNAIKAHLKRAQALVQDIATQQYFFTEQ